MSETQTAAVVERPQVASGEPILSIKHLSKDFRLRGGKLFSKPQVLHALSDVSLDVYPGETLGIIGESGCGKSTLGRCVVQLHQATSGQIVYGGQDITKLSGQQLKAVRKDIQMIFQDSYSSLDPRYTAAKTIEEPMLIYRTEPDASRREQRVLEVMREVGLDVQHLQRYPHEFSGGQRQRINVARAWCLTPRSSSATSPSPRLTSPSRRRCSTSSATCSRSVASRTSSSATTSRSSSTSPTALPSCTWGASWSFAPPTRSTRTRCTPTRGAPLGHPAREPLRQEGRDQAPGRDPKPCGGAGGLPTCRPLSLLHGALPSRAAFARGGRGRPSCGVLQVPRHRGRVAA